MLTVDHVTVVPAGPATNVRVLLLLRGIVLYFFFLSGLKAGNLHMYNSSVTELGISIPPVLFLHFLIPPPFSATHMALGAQEFPKNFTYSLIFSPHFYV